MRLRLLLISVSVIGLVLLFVFVFVRPKWSEGFVASNTNTNTNANDNDNDTVAVSLSDLSKFPEPHKVFSQLRSLLDKYDSPDVWNHASQMIDKDPGELARRQLGIINKA